MGADGVDPDRCWRRYMLFANFLSGRSIPSNWWWPGWRSSPPVIFSGSSSFHGSWGGLQREPL